eukprot:9343-Heterococcus_DN1.PRE.2
MLSYLYRSRQRSQPRLNAAYVAELTKGAPYCARETANEALKLKHSKMRHPWTAAPTPNCAERPLLGCGPWDLIHRMDTSLANEHRFQYACHSVDALLNTARRLSSRSVDALAMSEPLLNIALRRCAASAHSLSHILI